MERNTFEEIEHTGEKVKNPPENDLRKVKFMKFYCRIFVGSESLRINV